MTFAVQGDEGVKFRVTQTGAQPGHLVFEVTLPSEGLLLSFELDTAGVEGLIGSLAEWLNKEGVSS